ncbi:maker728 [Drosophila busckii]|uniref:Maker728 n=1 Tax=Drosophila busckii TaxID=30019 RepID=A0A0M3QWN7_DROBS|nr:microtubule-associated protein Jupiter [Drosophila busckii]ALC44469.1 maker728 [Drosophila busckii]
MSPSASVKPTAVVPSVSAESPAEPKLSMQHSASYRNRRNPITGDGINLYKLFNSRKSAGQRDGNPLTGQGYQPGRTDLEGLHKVHMKPGAFSNGRW